MASRNEPTAAQPGVAPQPFVPPSNRELRGQSMQRLQAGLFGLAFVLLIVALANIIMDRARLAESQAALPVATATKTEKASDPLADIGVVPKADGSSDGADRSTQR